MKYRLVLNQLNDITEQMAQLDCRLKALENKCLNCKDEIKVQSNNQPVEGHK